MQPTPCENVACAGLMSPQLCDLPPCIGSRCSQWVPVTHGSPPVENVGVCADNGKRLMIDRSAP